MVRPLGNKKINKKGLSPLALEIAESLQEYSAYKRGKKKSVKVYTRPKIPEDVNVKSIRNKLGMTQEQFTSFGFSLSAIRHWESDRRTPEGAARVLLMVIERNPSLVLEAIHMR